MCIVVVANVVFTPPVLSYVEQKALQDYADVAITKHCQDVVKFADTIDPIVFETEAQEKQLSDMVEAKRASEQRLIEVKTEYNAALERLCEMKFSERQTIEANELVVNAEKVQAKAK